MNESIIIDVVNKLNAAFTQRFPDIHDISVDNNEQDCKLTFKLGKTIDFIWDVKKEAEFIIMRCNTAPAGMTEDQLFELGAEITEKMGDNVVRSAINNRLVFQTAQSFKESSESADDDLSLEREIFTATMAFVQPLIQAKKKLRGIRPANITEDENGEEIEVQENIDPFGFDDIEIQGSYLLGGKEVMEETVQDEEDAEKISGSDNPQDSEIRSQNSSASTDIMDQGSNDQPPVNPASEMEKDDHIANEDEPIYPASENESIISVNENDLNQEIEALQEAFANDVYNPKECDGIIVADDDPVMALAMEHHEYSEEVVANAKRVGSEIDTVFDGLHRQITDAYQAAKEVIEKATELTISLHGREAALEEKEAKAEKESNSLAASRAALEQEQSRFMEERTAFDQDKTQVAQFAERLKDIAINCEKIQEENSRKEIVIAELTANLESAKADADDARKQLQAYTDPENGGVANAAYVRELRRKNLYQEEYITKQNERMAQSMDLINALRDRLSKMQANADSGTVYAAKEAEWKKRLADREKKISDLRKREDSWADAEAVYKSQIRNLTAQISATADTPSESLYEQLKDQKVQMNELKDKLEKVLVEKKELQERCEQLEVSAREEQFTEQTISKEPDTNTVALTVTQSMHEIGLNLLPIPGEAEMILGGTFHDCSVSFDAANRMMFVAKELKKPKKAAASVSELNEMNIQTTYSLNDGEMTCKASCYDVTKAASVLLEIVTAMDKFQ